MHRPNRVGEHMVVDFSKAPWEPTITGFDTDKSVVSPKVQTTTPDNFGFLRAYIAAVAIDANSEVSIGVPLLGGRPLNAAYQFNLVMDCLAVSSGNAGLVVPFFAKSDNASLVTTLSASVNPCTNWYQLPCLHRWQPSNGANNTASVQLSVIESDLLGGTRNNNPILAGWQIINNTAGSSTFEISLSINAWRYTQDIDTYERP